MRKLLGLPSSSPVEYDEALSKWIVYPGPMVDILAPLVLEERWILDPKLRDRVRRDVLGNLF